MKNLSWPDHLSLSCLMARRKASAAESSWTYPQRSFGLLLLFGILAMALHVTDQWSRKLATLMDLYRRTMVSAWISQILNGRKRMVMGW